MPEFNSDLSIFNEIYSDGGKNRKYSLIPPPLSTLVKGKYRKKTFFLKMADMGRKIKGDIEILWLLQKGEESAKREAEHIA